MGRRWPDAQAFRPDPVAASRPSGRQSLALALALVLIAGAAAAVSFLVRPDDARSFRLFHGSAFLADTVAPVSVDLATGQPTVRLVNATAQVGASRASDLAVVPMSDGTLLLNKRTGEFNVVDRTGFVMKTDGGVVLPRREGSTGAVGIASAHFAFIEQTGPSGTSVYLVGSTTVQSAENGTAKPRAFQSLAAPTSTAAGTSVSVGDDLWLLSGNLPNRTLHRLSLPDDSSPGARLAVTGHGAVDGPSALATAGRTVGVATGDHLSVHLPDGTTRTDSYPAVAGLDTVRPATGAGGRLAFLLHGSDGWQLVSCAADGSDLRGPVPLTRVAPTAHLIAPAVSRGHLYTMDTGSGQFLELGWDGSTSGLSRVSRYPLAHRAGRPIETGGFGDAYALSRGPRVVFNSPSHGDAVVVFTDGSRPPLVIAKSAAVTVSASGDAEAIARSRAETLPNASPPSSSGPTPKPPAPKPAQAPVNDKIDCSATSQKPHIPLLGQPQSGSRSVLLTWTYPVTGQSDCVPSTYVVTAETTSDAAPAPPGPVTVTGQQSVNLGGLFPSTRYRITVTAYLNGRGTRSAPIQIVTGPEGPSGAPARHRGGRRRRQLDRLLGLVRHGRRRLRAAGELAGHPPDLRRQGARRQPVPDGDPRGPDLGDPTHRHAARRRRAARARRQPLGRGGGGRRHGGHALEPVGVRHQLGRPGRRCPAAQREQARRHHARGHLHHHAGTRPGRRPGP